MNCKVYLTSGKLLDGKSFLLMGIILMKFMLLFLRKMKPKLILASVKGKGVDFMENDMRGIMED